MKDVQQRKLNKYEAELAFIGDNAAVFPPTSPGGAAAEGLRQAVALIHSLAGDQASSAARRGISVKDELLQDLIELLQKMNRAAKAMADDVDGIEDLFRMPRRRSEEIWMATARAFYNDSAAFDADFQEYDLPATFRADILSLITRIEGAQADADSAREQTGGATGGLVAAVRDAGRFSRKLNAIVRNKFFNDPRRLAAWTIASHTERAPRSDDSNATPVS